ncbi:hypothetical protein GDO81_000539 [Engystomops pustulosus]|uniref:Uncharacterized protein n=1 Tax=Engystomops pustulosus TaxID=76066 RepID=A0AAV7D5S8_ENGPU|nr:hypothetical protein GDO81_000539 [Engystomops pustulosus]
MTPMRSPDRGALSTPELVLNSGPAPAASSARAGDLPRPPPSVSGDVTTSHSALDIATWRFMLFTQVLGFLVCVCGFLGLL